MPRAILIGDSIRMGYEPFVRKELAGLVDVSGPAENGGTSENVLTHLEEWVLSQEPDCLHLNCGLHDLKRMRDEAGPTVDLERYGANLQEIFGRLKGKPGIRAVWATTTPVNEKWHGEVKGFDRLELDVARYNRAAIDVARKFGVPVNDLHAIVARAGRDGVLSPDGVHFTGAGYEILGHAVAGAVRSALGV